jgi:hypothetical protein
VKNPVTETILADANGWEVCSLLELNVSPKSAQTLRTTDLVSSKLLYTQSTASGSSLNTNILTPIVSTVDLPDLEGTDQHAFLPMSFKTNIACQAGSTDAEFSELKTSNTSAPGFIIKVFAKTEPLIVKTLKNTPFPYNNTLQSTTPVEVDMANWSGRVLINKDYNDIWSRISLDDIKTANDSASNYDYALKLPVTVMTNTYGIASIYVNYTSNEVGECQTWIEIPKGYSESDITLINADTVGWNLDKTNLADKCWKDSNSFNKLFLRPGVNCLKIKKSCNLIIKTTSFSQGELFYDNLRLVEVQPVSNGRYTQGLNLDQIGYYYTGAAEDDALVLLREEQLLNDLKTLDIDHEFYYNVPVERSMSLEFNDNSTERDTLLNPYMNYDINNINNSFVISKLDIDYLDTGLQIARSSRLN